MLQDDNSIDLFMWGYQRHYQRAVQSLSREVFGSIDPGLIADTFLIGLLRTPSDERHPICLEPGDCGWTTSQFASVKSDSDHFLALDGMENLITTSESRMNSIQRRRRREADRRAVLKVLESRDRNKKEKQFYFSGFIDVAGYDVGIILSLTQRDRLVYYSLPKTYADERYEVPKSFLESVAQEFLSKCLAHLYVPRPEFSDHVSFKPDEVLRLAGRRLLEAPTFATEGFKGLYGLFDACNYIASLNYEGSESNGRMIVANAKHPNIRFTLQIANPVKLTEHRSIRKLLEISRSGDSLVSDGYEVVGFATLKGKYDHSNADLFEIRFSGHHKWQLFHDGHKLLDVRYGLPGLGLPLVTRSTFKSTFEIIFGKNTERDADWFYELVLEAVEQRHGTILAICPEADKETKRLAAQATPILPVLLGRSLLRSVTAIDGAILLDLDGKCHCIGAILDGAALQHGSSGRGARYNSCIRYVSATMSRSVPCLALLVSEDGTAELLPDLPRRLLKSELEEKFAQLTSLLESPKWSLDKSFLLLQWLDQHRFYLNASLCDKANAMLAKHNEVLQSNNGIVVERSPFVLDPKMNPCFLE